VRKKRYLVVGSSAAGVGAIEAIRRADREGAITVVSDEESRPYSRCLLSYAISGRLDEGALRYRPDSFFEDMKVDALLGRKVVSVEPTDRQVVLDDGLKLEFDALLMATGASPSVPSEIPAGLDGVLVLRTLADARLIIERIPAARRAVVLGGGLVGMKAAFALAKRGLAVTVIVRSRHVLSQMIDPDAAQIVMTRLRENGIETLVECDIEGVDSREGRIAGVRAGDRDIPCDFLVAAKGVQPNMAPVAGTTVLTRRGVVTNERMETSVPGIYAAGDVAETLDVATGRTAVNALWTCAVQQGKVAGANMAGLERVYDGSLAMNSINFPGADLISFGLVRPRPDDGCEIMTDSRPLAGVYKKLVLKDGLLKGIILVNRIDNAGVLLSLLGRRLDISSYAHELLSDHFSYARVLGAGGPAEFRRYMTGAAGRR